jgi:hypothetical protein
MFNCHFCSFSNNGNVPLRKNLDDCFASMQPRVQTPVPPKGKGKKRETLEKKEILTIPALNFYVLLARIQQTVACDQICIPDCL